MPDKEKKQKGRPVKCQNVEKVLRNKIIDRCNKPPKPKGSVGRPPIPCDKLKEKYENKIWISCLSHKKCGLTVTTNPKICVPKPSKGKK